MMRIKGVGPVYVGYERWTEERQRISRPWFRELTPPWRMSKRGWRLRIGHRAFQIGWCEKRPLAEEPSALSQLGGYDLDVTPDQIGAWGRDASPPEGPTAA